MDLAEGENELLGYQLVGRAGGGAFGNVYRATSPEGETVAVKILHEEVRKTPEMLQSFRRGVRSMQILGNAKLDGIVRYRTASEIPAFVVMDWVEGPNLREVVQARQLNTWVDIMKVAHRLTKIIRSAHMLPDRVLHRDLRPANIMIEDYWADPYHWDVVVLDFDLSYHLGAREKTIDLRGESATGYLAPEQLQKLTGVSTRNAAVDSFGLGMTLYYLVSHRDPLPAEHMHSNWSATVINACRAREFEQWVSLPERVARIIQLCTRNGQAERWDLAQVEGELSRLEQILCVPIGVPSAELVAEELLARAYALGRYDWLEDELTAQIQLPTGLTISIRGDEASETLTLRLSWTSRGERIRKGEAKWLKEALHSATDYLRAQGWSVETPNTFGQEGNVKATIHVRAISDDLGRGANCINRVAQLLTFQ